MDTALLIDFPSSIADAWLRDQVERSRPRAIGNAIREDLTSHVRAHLARLDASRANQMGGVRTHFYEHEADSARHELTDTQLKISVGEVGLRQRYLGGVLKPKTAKWLTLPAQPEAYGKRAREFNNLRFVPFSADKAGLFVKEGGEVGRRRVQSKSGKFSNRKSTVAAGELMFLLKKSVSQAADPSVLPTDSELVAVAMQSARNFVEGFNS